MKRAIWQFLIIVFAVFRVCAQTPLEFFTNQANGLLQAQFGFGVTNIPVYCATNPSVGYSSAVHYVLQSAANTCDAATPATNLPSVFRPLFSWQSNTLFIIGYACVTTDFYSQTGPGFKTLSDPTITTNDNVWGIPWVIGAKGQIPAFNEYAYSSAINIQRELLFVRAAGANGLALTNEPPRYTNQFYIMSISNLFGSEAWNFYSTPFNRSVTLIASNCISITVTNNYDAGFATNFYALTNEDVESWPGRPGSEISPGGFIVSMLPSVTSLPISYWSESAKQFQPLSVSSIFPADLAQTGWPVHQWTLNITNNFMYVLIDNATRRVLDFVNLGGFGSSVDLIATLANPPGPWTVAPATDSPNSRLSEGAQYQIGAGIVQDVVKPLFADSLLGLNPCYPPQIVIFECPYSPSGTIIQNCSWSAANPMVHYTVQDLGNSLNDQVVVPALPSLESLYSWVTSSVCTLGRVNPDYTSGAANNLSCALSNGSFQINFQGTADLPYAVWGSTNLVDWARVGAAAQPSPGVFQFQDPPATYPNRFYQVQLP